MPLWYGTYFYQRRDGLNFRRNIILPAKFGDRPDAVVIFGDQISENIPSQKPKAPPPASLAAYPLEVVVSKLVVW